MEYLIQLRKEAGCTQKDLAEYLGISRQAYANYENDTRKPDYETLLKLSEYFSVSVDYLLRGKEKTPVPLNERFIPAGFDSMPEMVMVPLVGDIACGSPILAEENIRDRVGVPAAWRADFALVCHGDSMAPTICDGDIVCIRKQPTVETGQIAAVRIDDEATLKHFYLQGDTVQLVADNPRYAPLVYSGYQLEGLAVEGLAVGICRGLL